MKTKINLLLALVAIFLSTSLSAQVKGISYTIAPGANYTWFNNRAGLDEAFMVGGRFGIGFGEFVELRGLYYQTLNQQIDFAGLDIDTEDFDNTDIDLARYGAELKFNLGKGKFLPFVTFGGGVQDVGRDGLENAKNIYGTTGLGLTLAATDRFNFSIEGQYLAYRFNAVRNLLDQAERDLEGVDLDESSAEQLGNWTVGANLAFYLGGRKPGELSEIDRAYLNTFGNGIKGLRIPVEVEATRFNFDNRLAYADGWFGGVRAGLDFGPFVGIRGYYLQGMDNGDLSFQFDDIAVYGADFRFNLSRAGLGFTPFALLGAGRINVQDDYVGQNDRQASSQGFANAGLGLSMQLAKTIRLNGTYKYLITSTEEFGDINTTDELTTSSAVSIGLTFAFGNSPKPAMMVENMLEDTLSAQEEMYEQQLAEQRKVNNAKTRELRNKYESRVNELESELNRAYEDEDTDRIAELKEQKQQAQELANELRVRDQQNRAADFPAFYQDSYGNDGNDNRNGYVGNTNLGTTGNVNSSNGNANNNSNNAATIQLTFDEILELVKAANVTPATTNVAVYPGGVDKATDNMANSKVSPQQLDRVEEMVKGINNRATQTSSNPTDDQDWDNANARIDELRREITRLRDDSRTNGDAANEARYNQLMQSIDDMDGSVKRLQSLKSDDGADYDAKPTGMNVRPATPTNTATGATPANGSKVNMKKTATEKNYERKLQQVPFNKDGTRGGK